MPIIVTEPETSFTPAPAGAHFGVCCDVVDLGMVERTWQGETKITPMIRIVWQIEEPMLDGRPFTVSQRYTRSLHEKARLRKDLESWRGRSLSSDELRGFDLEKLIGVNALLNVIQEEKAGKVYSNLAAIMPPPRNAVKLSVSPDFVRRKDRDEKHGGNGALPPQSGPDYDREPGMDAEDDDPFGGAFS